MRNPERISKVLELLEIAWKASPDLRFFQLLVNVFGIEYSGAHNDFYYLEDDLVSSRLREYLVHLVK